MLISKTSHSDNENIPQNLLNYAPWRATIYSLWKNGRLRKTRLQLSSELFTMILCGPNFVVSWYRKLKINTSCWPPGMTEQSRHIKLTNQINFTPALCGPSNMNAFTIFTQNSSLVDNHSTKYISVTLIWMIKYVQYVIIVWIITSHMGSFYRHN